MKGEAIAQTLAGALNVPLEALRSKRKPEFAFARDLYAYARHTFGGEQVNDIAKDMGADRSTAGEWIEAVRRRLETDDQLEAFVDRIGERLTMQAQLRQRIEEDREDLTRLFPAGPTAVQLAFRYKVSVAEAAPLVVVLSEKSGSFSDRAWKGGEHKPSKDQSLSRFGTKKPEGGVDLKVNHPALAEARTIFPGTVVSPRDTDRLLVSGHNNPKLGAEIRKGPWKGFPIFHLTLEERATCPRSCALWAGCYGNAMHMARRHDHRDADFLPLLEMELTALAGKNPFGFAVRLHTLGDFYSVDYVKFWGFMMDALPSLHLFGFTANRALADNETECQIGAEIEEMNVAFADRCFIRFSGEPGQGGSRVFDNAPPAGSADGAGVLMCPAQTGATAACATCGLCWAPNAWEKCIGFLKHGMKVGRRRKKIGGAVVDARVNKLDPQVQFVAKPQGARLGPYMSIGDEMPASADLRWTISRKAGLVSAINKGEISVEDACQRYALSEEEINTWKAAAAQLGRDGLKQGRASERTAFIPTAASPAAIEAERISALMQKRRTEERIARDIRINESIIRHGEAPDATREARKEATKARELLTKLKREMALSAG